MTTQTKGSSCQTCHSVINALGFTLEHYDAVGRYREKDNNQSVNSTGSYVMRTGKTVTFNGVKDLAKFLAGSEEVHAAFVEQMFHQLVKQPIRAYGPSTLANLQKSFTGNGFHMRKLAVEIAVTSALLPPNKSAPLPTHYPPYTSKYNPIEHRVFPHLTRACQGIVFKSVEQVQHYMAKATTRTGLTVTVNILDKIYEKGARSPKDSKTPCESYSTTCCLVSTTGPSRCPIEIGRLFLDPYLALVTPIRTIA